MSLTLWVTHVTAVLKISDACSEGTTLRTSTHRLEANYCLLKVLLTLRHNINIESQRLVSSKNNEIILAPDNFIIFGTKKVHVP